MAISALSIFVGSGVSQAQAPPAPLNNQAPAQWSPFQMPTVEARPLPQLTPLRLPDNAPGTSPARTVTYQKSPGENTPQAVPAIGVPAIGVPAAGVPAAPTVLPRVQPPVARPVSRETMLSQTPAVKDEAPKADPVSVMPSKDIVFRLDSDQSLDKRILKELNPNNDKNMKLPTAGALIPAGTVYHSKTASYSPMQAILEPHYVTHKRLYFEETNSERASWDAGLYQPVLSAGYFYKDVVFMPYKFASGLLKDRYDTSAGKPIPGNPTPYYLYPPGYSVSGGLLEAGVITGLAFMIP